MTFLINVVNYAFFPDTRLLLSSTYYPYNFLVFCFVVFFSLFVFVSFFFVSFVFVVVVVVFAGLLLL